ncbi:amidase [Parapusillimonas granuli]|uniref:Amidase n=1 Tax=Parapusillimonas granuli TaxID=380911 RepID=A0A853FS60_9BURK|nr:amidase [Parapusillimonas granuli]MBB5213879.1 aspartyl-tRNA(Asn)/glutamyl-tRNA(Gln) amidotransferase subunit A [Parapusillimonas granuli]MEB2398958.1 amidase [Alcaligenaceae bacterium]NYT48714.1 amidase [Parapusillimonas granuli]
MELAFSSLGQLAKKLDTGALSALELTRHYLDRIEKGNAGLHAYVHVDAQGALQQARAADARRASGYSLGPLDGVPIAIKDLCDIAGQATTAGSEAWRGRVRHETATVVSRLLQAGMVVLGKLHMVEFAFGGWGLNPRMGTPVNPWGLPHAYIPGGSSSGSGVAVAGGLAPAALGSDTGGSVRIPAALNGITGLKTTSGLISRHGAVPLSDTLDSIGFLARTAEDAWWLSRLTAGYDAQDPATWHLPPAEPMAQWHAGKPLQGVHLALMDLEQFPTPASPAVVQAYGQARTVLQALGASVETYRLPFDFHELMLANGTIIAAESYAYHASYIEDPALPFGDGVRGRIRNGKTVDSASYIGALKYHREASRQWREWIVGHADALLMPTLPCAACRVDEVDENSLALASFTRAANFINATALSLPAGFSEDGLPVGVQLLGAPLAEPRLTAIGAAFQQETDWHLKTPDLHAVGL